MNKTHLDVVLLVGSSLSCAIAVDFFFIPYGLAPGGLTGLAIILSEVTNVQTAIMQLCIVIPLMLVSTKIFGKGFGIKTVLVTLLSSLFMSCIPVYDVTNHIGLSAILGGISIGISIGCALKAHAATGGTDILALLIQKLLRSIKLPTIMLGIDLTIIVLSGVSSRNYLVSIYSLISLLIINIVIRILMKVWRIDNVGTDA